MTRILVVDDESGITMVIKELLTRKGYDVLTAKSGKEALERLSLGPVDLLITDIVMPDMDGLELIAAVHQAYPKVRIIAMSGGGDKLGPGDYLSVARQLGVAYCLTKPFMLSELSSTVVNVLSTPHPMPEHL